MFLAVVHFKGPITPECAARKMCLVRIFHTACDHAVPVRRARVPLIVNGTSNTSSKGNTFAATKLYGTTVPCGLVRHNLQN